MQFKQLGNTGLNVSRLCLGTMTMGWSADKEESFAMMDYAVEHGINFFDTADIYSMWVEGNDGGVSEAWIGEWLQSRKKRNQVVLATKARGRMWEGPDGEGLSRTHLMRAVEDSLRRLQVETIDLYQSHWPDEDTPMEETLRAYEDMIKQGKVRFIGCSNHTAPQLRETLQVAAEENLPRYETLQPHYNLVHREEYEAELMGLCAEQNLGVIPYSPLEGGFLTGKYQPDSTAPEGSRGEKTDNIKPYATTEGFAIVETLGKIAAQREAKIPQLALAWLLSNPTITSVIVGASRQQQLADTISAGDITLSDTEKARLDNLPSPR